MSYINEKSSVELVETLEQKLKSQNATQLYDVTAETRIYKMTSAMASTEVLVRTFKRSAKASDADLFEQMWRWWS